MENLELFNYIYYLPKEKIIIIIIIKFCMMFKIYLFIIDPYITVQHVQRGAKTEQWPPLSSIIEKTKNE